VDALGELLDDLGAEGRQVGRLAAGPWQITPTGFPVSKKARTNDTARGSTRSWSGLATPPGSTRAS
jgi:hypothetical protein